MNYILHIDETLIENTLMQFPTLITNAQEVQERYQGCFLSPTIAPRCPLSEEMSSNHYLDPMEERYDLNNWRFHHFWFKGKQKVELHEF